jgi:hypothetical protein
MLEYFVCRKIFRVPEEFKNNLAGEFFCRGYFENIDLWFIYSLEKRSLNVDVFTVRRFPKKGWITKFSIE